MPLPCLAGPASRLYVSAANWPPEAGHFAESVQDLRVVYPRPDEETATWARHRWAYYNGSDPIQYQLKIGVMGGAWPYRYQVIAGPSGLTCGEFYADAHYGEILWTPSGSETDTTVTIRVTDAEGSTIDVTYTISTSSSTSVFLFIDSVNGNDTTGDGSIGAPFASIEKLFGLTAGAVTYPNTIVYMRAGSYSAIEQDNLGAEFKKDCTPMALMGFPGESVTIDHTTGGISSSWNCTGADGNDLYLRDFEFTGGNAGSSNLRHFRLDDLCNRITACNISAPDVFAGTVVNDNACMFFMNSTHSTDLRQYIFFDGLSETNREGSNGSGGFTAFSAQYVLAQRCVMTGSTSGMDLFLKAATTDCELRENRIVRGDAGPAFGTYCQIDGTVETARIDLRHNTVSSGSTGGGTIDINHLGVACGAHWVRRNTVLGAITIDADGSGQGPFVVDANAVQAGGGNNPVKNTHTNSAPGPNTTVSNTECHGSSGILDGDLLLTGAYRTSYYGTANSRGAEYA